VVLMTLSCRNPVFEAILKKYDPDYIRSFPE